MVPGLVSKPGSAVMLHPLSAAPGGAVVGSPKPPLLLVTMMPDDSGSIKDCGNAAAIRRGHNAQLTAYQNEARCPLFVRTRYLNGHVLFDYTPPAAATPMDARNYNPSQGTPLYDQTVEALREVSRSVDTYTQKYGDQHDIYTMTCIMTDGADMRSTTCKPEDVHRVVERMFASGRHIVAGIGVRDGYTDFESVFRSMGIPPQWIMVLERKEGDIVEGMTRFAQSSTSIHNAASYRATTMEGFAAAPPPPHARPTPSWQAPPAGPSSTSDLHAALATSTDYNFNHRPRLRIDLAPLMARTGQSTISVVRGTARGLAIVQHGQDFSMQVPTSDAMFATSGAFSLAITGGVVTVQNPSRFTLHLHYEIGLAPMVISIEPGAFAAIPTAIQSVQLVVDDGVRQQPMARILLPAVQNREGYHPGTHLGDD